uniref:Mur ligase domain-containing protein n=1 Tax=uncultured Alistipes sp. TaxID=538949 RepID=UPI00260FD0D5
METTSNLYDLFTAHPRVVTDSRHIVPGAIFFALRGATFDGNVFAAAALAAGAAAAVVDDPHVAAEVPGTLLVPDTLAALQQLVNIRRPLSVGN